MLLYSLCSNVIPVLYRAPVTYPIRIQVPIGPGRGGDPAKQLVNVLPKYRGWFDREAVDEV